MLRGYRLFVLALGLILCGAQPPKEQTQGKPSAHETEQPASKPYAPYPGYNPDPCYQAKDHDTADLCAQWRAAIAAEKAAKEAGRSTDWSIFATFLSAMSLVSVAYALKLTIDANLIAKETARLQLRAYVGCIDWAAESKKSGLHFWVTIKNSGQTPAKDLKFSRFLTSDARHSHDDLTFEGIGTVDLAPGNEWVKLSATYENDSKGLELAYIAEVRYSDIFGDRWSLKLLFKRDSSGRWMTVGDSDELNCVYPFGEHQKSRLIQSNRRSLATIRDAFAIMWRKVRNTIGALAT